MVVLITGGGTTEAARALMLTLQLSVPVKPIQVVFFMLYVFNFKCFLKSDSQQRKFWKMIGSNGMFRRYS